MIEVFSLPVDYVVMVSAAVESSEEAVTNKPHNEDFEPATYSSVSSYYDTIMEDVLTREGIDNSADHYEHITHENGSTVKRMPIVFVMLQIHFDALPF